MISARRVIGMLACGLSLFGAVPCWAQQKQVLGGPVPPPAGVESKAFLPVGPAKVDTGIMTVQGMSASPDPITSSPFNLPTDPFVPFAGRYSLRGEAGDGVGRTRGFTYLEAMIPLVQNIDSMLFADLRGVNFDHEDRWEYNLGGGYRWFSPFLGSVLGANAFYDGRKTDYHLYHQIGVGVEVLSPTWEFRSNGYFVVGPAHRQIGDTGFINQGITDNNFVFQRLQIFETAYSAVDMEIGRSLPLLERFFPRAYIGCYSLFANNSAPAYGVRGRMEAQLTERISLHFVIQNDRLFHTTVSGGLAIHFGSPAYRSGGNPVWSDVLHQRVVRDFYPAIYTSPITTQQLVPVPPPPPPMTPPPPPAA